MSNALMLMTFAAPLLAAGDRWQRVEQDPQFQVYANWGIAAAYGLIGLVALVRHCAIRVRSGRAQSAEAGGPVCAGLLFFTTYTLLVLFWAEIYHQARSMPTGALRPIFVVLNLLVYATQVGLWTMSTWPGQDAERQRLGFVISDVFLAVMSAGAAAGFLLYGGRLFLMLQRFPIESRGRRKKLREVGLVTTICAGCFSFRAVMVSLSAFDLQDLELDMLGHPLLNILYYSLVEILPTACVLYILRKLPPKRTTQGYQQIPAQ
ncbi:hypothetical protein QJQ45_010324 [Haematococcus lacustris]|nr:hypothetical protein QJQ45_010324 [Haematococcus lacustris]